MRFDTLHLKKMSKTPEGYLKGDAVVTRSGIFTYLMKDGSKRLELRHPNDVFDSASLASVKLVPVVVGHPEGSVTADNAKELAVGSVGETVDVSSGHVAVSVVVTDAAAVKLVEGGVRELSLGYNCETIDVPGEYDGQRYDARQINIRYNHLAIVDSARAGPNARIRLDSGDAQLETPTVTTKTVRIDGVEYEVPPQAAVALDRATARADAAEKTLADAKTESEKQRARADSAEEELKKDRAAAAATLAAAVSARVALATTASSILGDAFKADSTDAELMAQVVKAVQPEARVDGVTPDYLLARFHAAVEIHSARADGDKRKGAGGVETSGTPRVDAADSDAAFARMKKDMQEAHLKIAK